MSAGGGQVVLPKTTEASTSAAHGMAHGNSHGATYLIKSGLLLNGSNLEFHIEEGATVLVSNVIADWPGQMSIIRARLVTW